jgi:hypothetical protein
VTWFKLDDRFHSHPKVRAAGNAAVGLFVRAGTYAAAYETDGFVDAAVVVEFAERRTQVAALERAGLWIPVAGGHLIHDYLDYNPAADVLRKRRKWRDSQAATPVLPSLFDEEV